MSSSTSSSDAAGWPRFAAVLVAAALGLFAGLAALSVVIDPYDTGRLTPFQRPPEVQEQGPRTANVSRARNPAFDGAIFGNSHIQLVSPEVLKARTGIPFVSLIVPATGPKEQFVLLDSFLAHRARPVRALVFGLDGYWCTPDAEPQNWKPFPFWLYDPAIKGYLFGLLRYDTLERLWPRFQILFGVGKRKAQARPDGYWDYEQYREWRREAVAREVSLPLDSSVFNGEGRFPSLRRLSERLGALPPEAKVVLVRPPAYVTALPAPGSPHARSDERCRAAMQEVADARPNTRLIDWRMDRPENREIENFFDHTHYRSGLARRLEAEIAAFLDDNEG